MIALTDEPLDLAPLLAAVADPEHGGTATFIGTTRREGGGRAVAALHYEAYEELAMAEMEAIATEARQAYGATVALLHRVGTVAVGEPSVMVAASAGHRPAAFAACRFAIDALKARVPVWKQTVFDDGATSWIDGCAHPQPHPQPQAEAV
ncbi:MAG TPA: molybdenum cofactor biosynthesis protein MoaE [Miltoncostaeaceae bacterium]|jgi:molybdopterin synthase catalytic subunit|nr:molybdenum cofactor biosynthesis protein MoaE [Miltoncostaeaceae bacterium]